nr:ATP-grasp domain-containing protein [Candidatus Njordarchaeota archaeon]
MVRVLIYEYFTGGGLAESPSFPSVLSEGYAMLNSLLRDFSHNAGCETIAVLDRRVAEDIPHITANRMITVSSSAEVKKIFRSTISEVDAILVVAPETEGTLYKLTQLVEDTGGATLLGSSSSAVKVASNKQNIARLAKSLGVAVPEIVGFSTDENEDAIFSITKDLGFPAIVKPAEGAGSEGVYLINNRQDLHDALRNAAKEGTKKKLLAQQYVKGTDASVSVLSSRSGSTMPLSLNKQIIQLGSPKDLGSRYEGGYTPFDHPLRNEAFESAARIVKAVKGLRGYVGVDFVLTEDKPVLMEVNARITTSYAGLYRVLHRNGSRGVAHAIMGAMIKDKLPPNVAFGGYAYYSKLKLSSDLKLSKDLIHEISSLECVECPAFPEQQNEKEVFVVTVSHSLSEALKAKSLNEEKVRRIVARYTKT